MKRQRISQGEGQALTNAQAWEGAGETTGIAGRRNEWWKPVKRETTHECLRADYGGSNLVSLQIQFMRRKTGKQTSKNFNKLFCL